MHTPDTSKISVDKAHLLNLSFWYVYASRKTHHAIQPRRRCRARDQLFSLYLLAGGIACPHARSENGTTLGWPDLRLHVGRILARDPNVPRRAKGPTRSQEEINPPPSRLSLLAR